MTIPIAPRIGALVLATTGFYTYVGQMVPQNEVQPPEEILISADLTTADMVPIGRQIMDGKGLCFTCHTIGQTGALRFPDLSGVAGRATTSVPGLSDVEYFAQSMYEPDSYIVEGFNPGMPVINEPADRPHRSGDPGRHRVPPVSWRHADGHAPNGAPLLHPRGRGAACRRRFGRGDRTRCSAAGPGDRAGCASGPGGHAGRRAACCRPAHPGDRARCAAGPRGYAGRPRWLQPPPEGPSAETGHSVARHDEGRERRGHWDVAHGLGRRRCPAGWFCTSSPW